MRGSRNGWRRFLSDWQLLVGLAISLFFLYWAIRQAGDLRNVARSLATANYLYVAPALGVYFAGVAIRAIRWRVLLHPVKPLTTQRLFPIVVIGYMANDVLPARMGELVRAYILDKDEGISKSASLATIFIERVFDGVAMLLFIAAVALVAPLDPGLTSIVRLAGVALGGLLVFVLAAALSPTLMLRLTALVLPVVPVRFKPQVVRVVDRFLRGLRVLQDARALLGIFLLSVAAWVCEAVMYYLIGLGFALGVGFHAYVLTTAVANLGTMVPSSPGYVGTFEALAVFTLARFSVEGDLALSYTVALHAVLLIPVTLLGFYYMWRRHTSLSLSRAELDGRGG